MGKQITENEKILFENLKTAVENDGFEFDESSIGQEISEAYLDFIKASKKERLDFFYKYKRCFDTLSLILDKKDPSTLKIFNGLKEDFESIKNA